MSEYKLVPVEPTWEMTNAASENTDVNSFIDINNVYKAMLSASPTTDTVNIDLAEYEAMKAEIVRYKGLLRQLENVAINTKSFMAVMTYIKEARKAIDQERKV